MPNDGQNAIPQVGELWTLSWNNHECGKVVIGTVHDGYFTAFPVTESEIGGIPPAIQLDPIKTGGSSLIMWTQLPTGIGMHLLSRKIRYALTKGQLELILTGDPRARDITGISFDFSDGQAEISRGLVHGLINQYSSLCYNEWPSDSYGEAVLDKEMLEELNCGPKDILWVGAALDADHATALFEGREFPNEAQAKLIATHFNVENPSDLLRANESDFVDILITPDYKEKVHQLMLALNIDERQARSLWLRTAIGSDVVYPSKVRSDFEVKLESAFKELLSGKQTISRPSSRTTSLSRHGIRNYIGPEVW